MSGPTVCLDTTVSPAICCEGGGGSFLPITPREYEWDQTLRIFLYLFGLLWLFCGIAEVSDVFMAAIEKITSQKTRKMNPTTGSFVEVDFWNPTVANLTLMALGSSAPEILLSIIELVLGGMYSGDLGPSTIVGSAAFNLLCIIAVCIVAIPNGEVRKIKEVPVYCVTATFSILAYLWLLIILLASSPDVVEIWEGLMTFVFFFVLIAIAYAADRGWLGGKEQDDEEDEPAARAKVIGADMTPEDLAKLELRVREAHGKNISEAEIVRLIEEESGVEGEKPEKAQVSSKKVVPLDADADNTEAPTPDAVSPKTGKTEDIKPPQGDAPKLQTPSFAFAYDKMAILDNRTVAVKVIRSGDKMVHASVNYQTRAGTAKKDEDFKHIEGTLEFQPGEVEKEITVTVVNDVAFENREDLYVDILDNKTSEMIASASLVILDNTTEPGLLLFEKAEMSTTEGLEEKKLDVCVIRKGGAAGKVTCAWTTEDQTAKAATHFVKTAGVLEFEHGQMSATIPVTILPSGRYERKDTLHLILTNITGGAKLDPSASGGGDSCKATIEIAPDPGQQERILRIHSTLAVNWEKAKTNQKSNWTEWKEQIIDSIKLTDDDDEEEEDEDAAGEEKKKGPGDYFGMLMTLLLVTPWKMLFSIVPPPGFCGGWVCFCASLVGIGGLTAIVGDMAALLGCVMNIPDAVTAITLVALGTSVPDTFASKISAQQDPYADNSVGNVTGSNSVNVFLGLGMPWTLGAFWWAAGGSDQKWRDKYQNASSVHNYFGRAPTGTEGVFVVEAGGLAFSVGVFSSCAIACISLLAIRRKAFGGELGGPPVFAWASAVLLVCFWFIYIALSSWYIMSGSA
mmetsp:Transcript_17148/g.30070  ORF Transcript_17148/g.30070 Transcript_17148/m.30070 type:complete len:852 (-) Transcript_17148:115-2670(-)|eukprot:CAMPEP_0197651038 /NCGR_PEP_ID=MMETSP1338-20131121/31313_1 /TAXON_ID=43686 ORGANISM="Pelagodinium beii, Strain RCC1491" /NCGR_SAMPLE_ID=MMETSP1338 /ASSEMBLY_ACC=CAM_ASM_000754 /LENGTH=851 /DNA_ID=CAMNT_0043225583 /DNA_START=103 /DNA_END=2658 /DNA_ORIENTATION=-